MESLTRNDGRGADLAQPFVDALPVHGASVSTLGTLLGTGTVSATDQQAARIDELQFDLGEGPCWDAMLAAAPVLEPDIRNSPGRVWPAFSEAIRSENIGAIFAFPLVVGPLHLGAVDLYCSTPQGLSAADTQRSEALSAVVGRLVLRRALAQLDQPESLDPNDPFFRRTLHQATGMVLAQLNIPPDDARLVIQAHAFATSRPVQAVAEDILARRLDFSVSDSSTGGPHD
ncbi:ANTAR domain-containing protein [Mycetocola zhadangensis]|uniref:ANTAR domain-containing protein n=2 Tax=Mycetocola zhadangensis TaxID=1164595 RepID=A0A3L7IXG2_9MICO|nr:ANTAR domain-containing protein [Mycetocola zhadangensis]